MSFRSNIGLINFGLIVIVFLVLDWRIRSGWDKADVCAPLGSSSKSIVFYNRIPKTGSTTFTNALGYDLSTVNHFHTIHLNLTKNNFAMNIIDQSTLVRNISTWSAVVPAFYHGHVAFVDFTRFGYQFGNLFRVVLPIQTLSCLDWKDSDSHY